MDVASTSVRIWCLLILKWRCSEVHGKFEIEEMISEMGSEVWSKVRFRIKGWSYGVRFKSTGVRIGESGVID